jgi:uncharacterized membrane protein
MSAFLGKIHYWLYDKIKLHENLIQDIVILAENKGYKCETLIKQSYMKYGEPITGSLENEIEHANIHGWLQQRIVSVESRLAYVVTELLNKDIVSKEEIADVFYQNAEKIANQIQITETVPQDLFNIIFDYMLEGMPCDRVNEIIENNEEIISWSTTRDLHKDYWTSVGGDINNFYYFRDLWINGFLEAGGSGYRYIRTEDELNIIRRA